MQKFLELCDELLDEVVGGVADPLVCGPLSSLSPGVPGVVDINSQGDVAIAGILIWDCPPYGS